MRKAALSSHALESERFSSSDGGLWVGDEARLGLLEDWPSYPAISLGTGFSNDAPTPVSRGAFSQQCLSSSKDTPDVDVPSDGAHVVHYDTGQVVEAGWLGMLSKGRAEEEERHKVLVQERESLSNLANAYHSSNVTIVTKIRHLEETFRGLRRSRGDGNCFYRSFLFAYLEKLVDSCNIVEVQRMRACLQGWASTLDKSQFPKDRYAAGLQWIYDLLSDISGGEKNRHELISSLEICMRDWDLSMQAIQFIRFVAASEILRREEHFAPFVAGLAEAEPVTEFCKRRVAMMGEESDHLQLVAVSDALQVPIQVAYLDDRGAPPNGSSSRCHFHTFSPLRCEAFTPIVHTLFRPGHYDILYEAAAALT